MKLIEDLKWRYAVKKYSTKKVPEEKLEHILDAINLSASSSGMQPYRLFVLESPEIRKELYGNGPVNAQIIEASHLIVFAAFEAVTSETIDNHIQFVSTERGIPLEKLSDLKHILSNYLLSRTNEENFNWSAKQAYLALGTGLIAAASEQIDATPMEGFNATKLDLLLGLKEKGLKSVVLLALGYRDEENDWNAKLKKIRVAKNKFVTVV